MINDEKFSEIRPYRDSEFGAAIRELFKMPEIDSAIKTIFPEIPLAEMKESIKKIPTISEFQRHIVYNVLTRLLNATADSFGFSGAKSLKKDRPYLFISNHRDITLDPSLISYALVESDMRIPEIAIGDNLLKRDWIRKLCRINGSFIVKRNLPPRELVMASRLLSEYIYTAININKQSVWIAQREGRAKDGHDVTQSGVLGMLAMSSTKSITEHFADLDPVPVSISYEYDPTDSEKVKRIYAERFLGGYKKDHEEDENSMKNGIMGHKGRIHIHFGEPLKEKIEDLPANAHKSEIEGHIKKMLDYQIIAGYKLWPVNHIAKDLFEDNKAQFEYYSADEKAAFEERVETKLETLEGEKDKLRKIFYEIYGRPAINKSTIAVEDRVFNSR